MCVRVPRVVKILVVSRILKTLLGRSALLHAHSHQFDTKSIRMAMLVIPGALRKDLLLLKEAPPEGWTLQRTCLIA